ncbi:MAG: CHAT domain-containing tetratricopeptide repeat protein [Bacteroidota bacterium]
MKRRLLLFTLSFCGISLFGQNWEELYQSTDDCWGKDWKACSQILLQTLEAAEKEHGEISEPYVMTLQDLGICFANLNEYTTALPYLKKGFQLSEKIHGTDNVKYISSLASLGILYMQMDEYFTARPLLEKAVDKTRTHLGKDHPQYEVRIDYLGNLYQYMGMFDKALPLLQEQVRISEQRWGKAHMQYAISIRSLGDLYLTMDHFAQSLLLYEEALTIIAQQLGDKHQLYGNLLGNIALLYERSGRKDTASVLFEEALTIIEATRGKSHPNYAWLISYLGNLYTEIGKLDEAMAFIQESNELMKQIYGLQHPNYALSLTYLGGLYRRLRKHEQALATLEEAKQIIQTNLGKEHVEYSTILSELGMVNLRLDKDSIASLIYEELYTVLTNQLSRQFPLLDDRLQTAFLSRKKGEFDLVSSFASIRPQFSRMHEIQYDQQLLLKGFLQNNRSSLFENLRQHPDSQIQDLFLRWNDLHNLLARQYQQTSTKRMSQLDSLQFVADQLEVQLINQSQAFRKSRQQVHWKDVQNVLTPDEAAIEFSSFEYYRKDSFRYAAILLRPTDPYPEIIPLFTEGQLAALLTSDQQHNSQQLYQYRGITPKLSKGNHFQNLSEILWEPLAPYLKDIKTLYFSPTALLHRINFGAIPINDQELISDKYHLNQLGSTKNLVLDQEAPPLPSSGQVVLIGGIDYDRDPIASDLISETVETYDLGDFSFVSRGQTNEWQFLPGTQTEVRKISQLFQEQGRSSLLRMRAEASEDFLKGLKDSPRVLHIATHGYFFPDPTDSIPDIHIDPSLHASIQLSDHPMVRSGLILAGANHAWQGNPVPAGQEDGILTAYEISRMDLSHTELVVLSACETGLGDIQGNEGVYGLQRAFKIAGAKYILMSLWQVPDQATQELMTAFYEYWLGGMEIRAALQEAQKEIRKKYKEPYFWAGFVLVE